MRSDQRQFYIFDLEIDARKEGAAIPDMSIAVGVWDKMFKRGQIYKSDNGDRILTIGDLSPNTAKELVVLLIRISDKKYPNSVYSDLENGTFDEHVKQAGTGADFACHVLISTKAEQGMPNVYCAAIEKVPGLPSGLIRRLLSKMLHNEFKENSSSFTYPHPGGGLNKEGNPRLERCCPHVELRGRPSQGFIDDIENGKLTGVTLIKTEAVTPLHSAGYLLKEKSELSLQVDHGNLPANLWNSLKSSLAAQSANFDAAKLAYRLPNSRRSVTVEIDTATATPLDELYVQAFDLINIFPPLAQSTKKIVPHLILLAEAEFVSYRTI